MSLDYLFPYSKPFEEPPERFPNASNDEFWTTEGGITKHYSELEDSHLINIIRMIWRKRRGIKNHVESEAWNFYCTLQGEHAIDAMESEIDHLMVARYEDVIEMVVPIWPYLLKELKKRNYKFWGIVRDVP